MAKRKLGQEGKIPRFKMNVELEFRERTLGTKPADPNVFATWIAGKAPTEEKKEKEIAMHAETIEDDENAKDSHLTIFLTEDGQPCLEGYQIRGFFKEAARAQAKVANTVTSQMKAYVKEVDSLIFIRESVIPIVKAGEMDLLERPLRASTPQGERVTLTVSESIPAGSKIRFTVLLYNEEDALLVREWLDYGYDHGIGQWRNSGKGSFVWTELDDAGNVVYTNRDKDPWEDAVCCVPDDRHTMD